MKATDLMVGDWIMYGDKPVQVLQLTVGKEYKGFFPIPLTPEILEKNGFRKSNVGENYTDYVFLLDLGGYILACFYKEPIAGVSTLLKCNKSVCKGGGVNEVHLCTIGAVHDLQHALKLCGISKEIVI